MYAIPAIFDTTGSTLNFFGLIHVTASVYQMMRTLMILLTTLFSKLFLRRKYYRHHLLGLWSIVVGLTLVGTFSYLDTKKSGSEDQV